MKIGLDIGSTTIKCVVLDDALNITYKTYERHFSHIVEKAAELVQRSVVVGHSSSHIETTRFMDRTWPTYLQI